MIVLAGTEAINMDRVDVSIVSGSSIVFYYDKGQSTVAYETEEKAISEYQKVLQGILNDEKIVEIEEGIPEESEDETPAWAES